jgi:hypothetical protein
VEEFRKPLPPSGLINTLKRKLAPPEPPPVGRFALPDIPTEWKPTNVSLAEKRYDVIEKAKKTPGFPNTDDAYYQPAELALQEHQRAINYTANERAEARRAIEKRTGIPYAQLTRMRIRQEQDVLNIDPLTEQFRPKTTPVGVGGAGYSAPDKATSSSITPPGPSSRTRSRSPRKRQDRFVGSGSAPPSKRLKTWRAAAVDEAKDEET